MKVAIHLTHDCNLRCTYCYVGKKYGKRMTRETAEEAVRFAHLHSTNRVDISFFGGEPLLEKELIFQTIDYSNRYRREENISLPVRYFVTTNGMLLDEPFLEEARSRHLHFALSLDGNEKGHNLTRMLPDGRGSFSAIARNFPAILKHVPTMEVILTFTPANVRIISDGVRDLHSRGFKIFFIGPNYEEEWSSESLEIMRQEYENLSEFYEERFTQGEYIYLNIFDGKIASHVRPECEICSCCDKADGEIAVAPSGNIYPCLRFVKEDSDQSLLLGSLKDGLNKKLRAKLMMEAAKEWRQCGECAYRGRCFHYCSALNFKATGKFNQPPAALCFQEKCAIVLADRIAERLYERKNPQFLLRFYGEKSFDNHAPAKKQRKP